jgi:hypothetical protein
VVSADGVSPSGALTAPAINNGGLLLAFVSADGPRGARQKVTAVSGGGLTWSLVRRSNARGGTAEVWQAFQPSDPTDGIVVSAQLARASSHGSISVVAFADYVQVQTTTTAAGASARPQVTLTPHRGGSMVWAVGLDESHPSTPIPLTGQTLVHATTSARGSFWVQRTDGGVPDAPVTVGGVLPRHDRWQLVAVEVAIGS